MTAPRNVTDGPPPDERQRYRLFRLCECEHCEGTAKVDGRRCPECRGEGRTRDELATCATPEAVGVAIVTLAREGEFVDADGQACPLGLLDTMGEHGRKWLVLPWTASPRNASDAGRLLRTQRRDIKTGTL